MLGRALRIECELCRALVSVDRFRSSASGIDVDCPACERRFFVAAQPPHTATATPTVTIDSEQAAPAIEWRPVDRPPTASGAGSSARQRHAMTCPKCDERQPGASACRRCGLSAARFDDFAASAAVDLPPEVDEAWRRCLARWGDRAAHEAFTERVAAASAYAHAARMYRERLRAEPADELARAQLERMGRMAEAAAFTAAASTAHRAGATRSPYRAAIWLLVLCGLLAIGGSLYAILTRDAGSLGPDLDAPMEWKPTPPPGRGAPPPGRGAESP
jgi:hypothetical protein